VVPPGLILGALCFLKKDPPRGFGPEAVDIQRKASLRDYMIVFKIPSYLLDTAGCGDDVCDRRDFILHAGIPGICARVHHAGAV